jgi:hypothetical protein
MILDASECPMLITPAPMSPPSAPLAIDTAKMEGASLDIADDRTHAMPVKPDVNEIAAFGAIRSGRHGTTIARVVSPAASEAKGT